MENIYKAPEAALVDAPSSTKANTFFVTSIQKMTILFIATLGLYVLYWGYKQWDSQRASMQPKRIYPIWRTLFMIFFTHSLSRRIADSLAAQNLQTWAYSATATLFVVLTVVSNLVSQGTSKIELPAIIELLILVGQLTPLIPMITIQRHANLASGDPDGKSNAGMSASNIVFIVLGSALWLLVLASLAVLAFVDS